MRVDKSIGTKSAKIVGVLVADLNISRRVADGYSTFEVLEFQLAALSPSPPLRESSCQFATLRGITGALKGPARAAPPGAAAMKISLGQGIIFPRIFSPRLMKHSARARAHLYRTRLFFTDLSSHA